MNISFWISSVFVVSPRCRTQSCEIVRNLTKKIGRFTKIYPKFQLMHEFLTLLARRRRFLTFVSNFSLFATIPAKFSLFQPAPLPRRPAHFHASRPYCPAGQPNMVTNILLACSDRLARTGRSPFDMPACEKWEIQSEKWEICTITHT